MSLHQITSAIRAYNGEVLLCGPTSFGYIVRAVISGTSCRIVTDASKGSLKVLPWETNVQTHIVSEAPSLQAWLYLLTKTQQGLSIGCKS
ncbi:hypothetical protein GCM10028774_52910 [Spirosoma jeollabukense]